MPSVVMSAMRARRTQTAAVFALTVLAALSASAAPWFLAWGPTAVAASDIAAAPAEQRVVSFVGSANYHPGEPSPLSVMRTRVEDVFSVPGAAVSIGGAVTAVAATGTAIGAPSEYQRLSARGGICAELVIEGECPTGDRDVIVDRWTAAQLKLHVGDSLTFTALLMHGRPPAMRVSGIYAPRDAQSPYWAGTTLLSGPFGPTGGGPVPSAFVTEQTLLAGGFGGIEVDCHVVVPPSAFGDGGTALRRQVQRAMDRLQPDGVAVHASVAKLLDAIQVDGERFRDGVATATVELVALSWFALFLAVRQTSVLRRTDLGLLKLRGGPRRQIAAVIGQQSALPMLAGVVAGALLGGPAAAALAGSGAALRPAALAATALTAAAAAALVGVGALLVALVAEASALRSPVLALMRRVPRRRSGWRTPAADLVVVALALAGVYQGRAELAAGGQSSVFALAAPALLGLAVAVAMARALPWVAARWGARALAAGRPGTALGALHMARRPGTERVFLVMAVAVSVMSTTVFFGASARTAWAARAQLELGAPRVLVVSAPNSAALLTDVRAADPAGRYAMAVAYDTRNRTLAVDTTRLAAVVRLSPAYGLPDVGELARRLRPVAPSAPVVHDGPLAVDLATAGGVPPVTLRLAYTDTSGRAHTGEIGPLAAGRHVYRTAVDGCATGCRLVSLEPVTVAASATVSVYGIGQDVEGATATVADAALLGDIRRWRSQLGPDGVGPLIAADQGRLDITVTSGPGLVGRLRDNRAYYDGAPVPVPVVVSGPDPAGTRAGDPRLAALGGLPVPYTAVGHATVLPAAGAAGALMDLEYAQYSIGATAEAVDLQVWLRDDTPPAVVRALRSHGVGILSDTNLAAATAALARRGSGLALRFELFVAAVGLLLATGSLVVAVGVARDDRAAELRALRAQGLVPTAMRRAGYAATVPVAVAAVLTGVASALIAARLVTSSLPVFSDGWDVLGRPSGVAAAPALLALAAALAALLPAALSGTARMIRSVERAPRRESR